jgi:acyl transferase domain-containing protein
MEPMLTAFERVAADVVYSSPRIKLISNVTGELATAEIATPEYWCNHVRLPVRFAAGMESLHQQGYEVFVESGSKPTLLGMGRYCLPEKAGVWLPSLYQGRNGLATDPPEFRGFIRAWRISGLV